MTKSSEGHKSSLRRFKSGGTKIAMWPSLKRLWLVKGMIQYVVAEVMNLIVHKGQKNHNNLLRLVVGRAA